jgi:hypothetical protein
LKDKKSCREEKEEKTKLETQKMKKKNKGRREL